jgi:hypothetical protein
MDDSNKKDFAVLFYGTGELYDKPVTKNLLQLYFNALKTFSIDEITTGVNAHMMDSKHGSFFPKPADIVRHLQTGELSTENKAELAWAQVMREIRVTGSYGSLKLDDRQALAAVKSLGTWKQLCASTVGDMTWKKKEFMSMYETYEKTPLDMLPSSLPGRIALVEHKKEQSESMKNILNGIEKHRAKLN